LLLVIHFMKVERATSTFDVSVRIFLSMKVSHRYAVSMLRRLIDTVFPLVPYHASTVSSLLRAMFRHGVPLRTILDKVLRSQLQTEPCSPLLYIPKQHNFRGETPEAASRRESVGAHMMCEHRRTSARSNLHAYKANPCRKRYCQRAMSHTTLPAHSTRLLNRLRVAAAREKPRPLP
jgi:hypothetical protein